jgi:hypothetical protein
MKTTATNPRSFTRGARSPRQLHPPATRLVTASCRDSQSRRGNGDDTTKQNPSSLRPPKHLVGVGWLSRTPRPQFTPRTLVQGQGGREAPDAAVADDAVTVPRDVPARSGLSNPACYRDSHESVLIRIVPFRKLTMRYWKTGLAGAAVVAAASLGVVMTRPADGRLTATVYKTPT